VDFHPGHVAAAREGRGEHIMEHGTGGADVHDLVAEDVSGDLTPDHAMVRRGGKRVRGAAEVDEHVTLAWQGRHGDAAGSQHPRQHHVHAVDPLVSDTHTLRRTPDVTVAVEDGVDRGHGGGALTDDRDGHSRALTKEAVGKVLEHRDGQHDVARAGHRLPQGSIVGLAV
jgi:hypothetical protein